MFISFFTFIVVVFITIGSSFALFTGNIAENGNSTLQTNSVNLTISYNSGNAINNQNLKPMTDSLALTQTDNIYTFSIKNTGTIPNSYTIRLVNNPSYLSGGTNYNSNRILLDHKYIRYKFQSEVNKTLSTLNNGMLETGTIAVNETKTYTLRIWVGDSTTYNLPNSALLSEIHLNIIVEGKTLT